MIPGSANTLLLTSAAAAGGYQVERSIRLNAPDSAYLSRTPASAGSGTTWSLSFWVKKTGNDNFLLAAGSASSDRFNSGFNSSDKFFASVIDGNSTVFSITTDAVFRDPSAWYHFLLVADTTNGTQADRFKIFVNGVRQTVSGTLMPSSQNTKINGAVVHTIGVRSYTAADYFSGYLADVHLIDGQALTPSSFTETSATTGQLIPKAYSGSFGTNGFWLKFSDNSNNTATTLGKDYSSNGNNWTPNNLSVTAGAGNDSLVDTPTSYGTDTGAGGEVRGNYCTWNPLDCSSGSTFANGNLEVANNANTRATISVPLGAKIYFECQFTSSDAKIIGFAKPNTAVPSYPGAVDDSYGYQGQGYFYTSTSTVSTTASAVNDVIMVAIDRSSHKIWFGKNGTWFGSGNPATGANAAFSSVYSAGDLVPTCGFTGNLTANFGQRPFAYTAPSGFKALCTANLPAPTITNPSTVMDVKLYTGNSSTQTISGLGFSPDFVWLKQRTNAENHGLFDTVRGAQKSLCSNNANAENTTDTNSLTAFTSDGFSLGNTSRFNDNTYAHVAWAWDAGTSNATNTQGTITSTIRANISAGFSIVTYTGTGSNATVGHGLGVAPQLVIVKRRDTTGDWATWHTSIANTNYLLLNSTAASTSGTTYWNSTSPTSSLFSVGTATNTNANTGTYAAYCWTPVAGYSAFGSYVGNGSAAKDGPFIYTGFRPRWIMIKNITFASDYTSWLIQDTARSPYNVMPDTNILWANKSVGEGFRGNGTLASAYNKIDAVSNGFKIREESTHELNDASATYIYAAFAEHPFALARAR